MKWTFLRVGAVATVTLIGLALWATARPAALPARFGPSDCVRLALSDPRTGAPVVGAEDLAVLPGGRALILTAHDRRDPARPDGGLYRLDLTQALRQTHPEARQARDPAAGPPVLVRLDRPDGSFRPHGFALDPDRGRLALINRPSDGPVRIVRGALGTSRWQPDRTVSHPALCRANDLVFMPDGSLEVTLDRVDCGPSLRDLRPGANTGRRMSVRDGALVPRQTGLQFANGLLDDAIAETRAQRIRTDRLFDVPGGPDNLTRAPDGRIVAALHPNLILNMLALQGWLDRIPSRVIALHPATGKMEVLFDDPSGRVFSGATVAVLTSDTLVLGSAIDSGLLMCAGQQ